MIIILIGQAKFTLYYTFNALWAGHFADYFNYIQFS